MKKIVLSLIISLFLFSCNNENIETNNKKSQTNKSIKTIYTSFYPIYYITKELIGKEVNVINLLPEGGEPHEFEPNLKTIEELSKSDLIILNGLGIERYEDKLIETLKNKKVFMLSENLVDLINLNNNLEKSDGHNHGNIDPHTWLSPKTYKEMANLMINELEKVGYTNLNKAILIKIDELDKQFEIELSKCSKKEFVTSHEAFSYLARDYNLKQKSIFGINPEEEPKAKDIANIIEYIKKEKIPVIYGEKFISKKFIDAVQKETNSEVLELYPLETLTIDEIKNGENYISIMKKNLEALKEGLNCK